MMSKSVQNREGASLSYVYRGEQVQMKMRKLQGKNNILLADATRQIVTNQVTFRITFHLDQIRDLSITRIHLI